jgi:hypothetical protein
MNTAIGVTDTQEIGEMGERGVNAGEGRNMDQASMNAQVFAGRGGMGVGGRVLQGLALLALVISLFASVIGSASAAKPANSDPAGKRNGVSCAKVVKRVRKDEPILAKALAAQCKSGGAQAEAQVGADAWNGQPCAFWGYTASYEDYAFCWIRHDGLWWLKVKDSDLLLVWFDTGSSQLWRTTWYGGNQWDVYRIW